MLLSEWSDAELTVVGTENSLILFRDSESRNVTWFECVIVRTLPSRETSRLLGMEGSSIFWVSYNLSIRKLVTTNLSRISLTFPELRLQTLNVLSSAQDTRCVSFLKNKTCFTPEVWPLKTSGPKSTNNNQRLFSHSKQFKKSFNSHLFTKKL